MFLHHQSNLGRRIPLLEICASCVEILVADSENGEGGSYDCVWAFV